ncbi:diguanylate cyclase [Arenimonas sp.]|uniref:GGDEF domain-containing protein n=1 Tax=Arenimonas sp. TaxID=1872635 RepID=UPI0035B1ECE1
MSVACRRTAPLHALVARTLRAAAWCLGLLLAGVAGATVPPATLDAGVHELDLLPHLAVLEDPDQGLQLADVLNGSAASRFTPLGDRTASFGYSDSAWWLRARVANTSGQPRDLVLRQSYVLLDYFDLYLVDQGRVLRHWTTGDTLPYSTRPIPHRDYLFPLTMEPGQTLSIYLRAHSEGPVNAALVLYGPEALGLLPHTWLTQYGFQIGTIFEFVLLSVALGIRVKEIRQQSRTDSLTGLANRSRYDELVGHAFAQAEASGSTLGLLVIDVDHFKQVNDAHGHAIGDRVLEGVAESLRRHLPPQAVASRYGGEEFVVLVPRTDDAALMRLAEELRRAVAAGSPGIPVTASIGFASTAGQAFTDPRGLFRAADEALYAAKRIGRNRVVGWNQPPSDYLSARPTAVG